MFPHSGQDLSMGFSCIPLLITVIFFLVNPFKNNVTLYSSLASKKSILADEHLLEQNFKRLFSE